MYTTEVPRKGLVLAAVIGGEVGGGKLELISAHEVAVYGGEVLPGGGAQDAHPRFEVVELAEDQPTGFFARQGDIMCICTDTSEFSRFVEDLSACLFKDRVYPCPDDLAPQGREGLGKTCSGAFGNA